MDLATLIKYLTCGACGVAFGIAAEKGRVHEPGAIRHQMDFSSFVMVKMFLGAVTSGLVCMSLLPWFSSRGKRCLDDARASFVMGLRDKSYMSAIVGGAMLGAGMTVAGACPGMVLVQVGSKVQNSLYTLAGGLLGVIIYAVTENTVVALTRSKTLESTQTLDSRGSYSSTALPLAAIMGCSIAALEVMYPSNVGLDSVLRSSFLKSRAWPPYVAGAMIGALQPVIILTVSDTLGSSSSYCTVVSQCLITSSLRNAFSYLNKYASGLANWWQVVYVAGAVLGAHFSASSSHSLNYSSPVSPAQGVLGGALMLYGARLAAGCTSGHGLSGLALMVKNSFVAVASMFAGAIVIRAVMKEGFLNI